MTWNKLNKLLWILLVLASIAASFMAFRSGGIDARLALISITGLLVAIAVGKPS